MPSTISGDSTPAVLDAAASCYLRLGVTKTTATDIARAAGMSRATLYRRFGSHEAIFMAVLERESAAMAAEAAEYLAGIADPAERLNPPLRAMHPFGATLAEECVTLFMYDLRTLALEIQAHVPSYARWLEQADMAPAYAQHKLALQTLQSTRPTERWVLKTPNHLWHLAALRTQYPDARIIWTHRDPGPVVTSLASLANAGQRPQTARRDPRPAATEWRRKCRFALESAMRYDDSAPAGWCRDVRYDAVMADPVGEVSALYRSYGDEVTDEHARLMTGTSPPCPRMHSAATDTTRPILTGRIRISRRSSANT